jgi:L-fuculokinase
MTTDFHVRMSVVYRTGCGRRGTIWSGKKDIRVDALHFATYGASFVHLDNTGKPVTPLYSYFKPLTERLTAHLYKRYGGREQFALDTASPAMGMLNSGLQLYWLKAEKPTLFSSIHRSLHLPQYCSYLFTGTVCSEHTSIGCHTALWDFTRHEYHRWLRDEEIEALLPPIQTEIKAGEIRSNDRAIPVGVGLHDSSAALVPYLQSFHNAVHSRIDRNVVGSSRSVRPLPVKQRAVAAGLPVVL